MNLPPHFFTFKKENKEMEKQVKGDFASVLYYPSRAIRILNPLQAAMQWSNGVVPLDIYPSKDYKTQEPILVYVFNRDETNDVFHEWCEESKKHK